MYAYNIRLKYTHCNKKLKMSQDDRDNKHLRHALGRAQQPKRGPVNVSRVENADSGEIRMYGGTPDFSSDTIRWLHVGTSPQLSAMDKIQARKRFQTYMADN